VIILFLQARVDQFHLLSDKRDILLTLFAIPLSPFQKLYFEFALANDKDILFSIISTCFEYLAFTGSNIMQIIFSLIKSKKITPTSFLFWMNDKSLDDLLLCTGPVNIRSFFQWCDEILFRCSKSSWVFKLKNNSSL